MNAMYIHVVIVHLHSLPLSSFRKKELDTIIDDQSKEIKDISKQLDKAKVPKDKNTDFEDANKGMESATNYKKQKDAKDVAPIAKGTRGSKAKEMVSDKEKEIKKPKKPNTI